MSMPEAQTSAEFGVIDDHRLELQKIDMSLMTDEEAIDYTNHNFPQLFTNFKREITKPLLEIKYYNIFKLNNSENTIVNIKGIEYLMDKI